ncbi:MAG: glycosyltransferase [Chloroflexi bacterium]|nr:glycosyltransferase [Chloroflexota bacterium]
MTAASPARALRVVMFVYNDVSRDSRVLREAKSLADAGHRVTIMGRPHPNQHEITRQQRDGFEIVLVPIPHEWRTWWYRYRKPWHMYGLVRRRFLHHLGRGPAGWLRAIAFVGVAIVVAVASLVRLPYGHDLTGLPAAVGAQARKGGVVVYDSHESFMDSGSNVNRPAWAKWLMRRFERRQARHAVALVTVNRSLGELLGSRFGLERVVVVYNTPARWEPPAEAPDLLRRATELPPGTPIALYHGAFSPHRGVEELAEAILLPGMEAVHAVFLGYGSLEADLRELAAEPRFGGRVHVLKAVSPGVLPAWVASADVGVMAIQASTLNHRLSSPNKLFESIATGLPVVVSDFLEMRRIVLDDPDGPLGAVCDPADPASIASAIRSILDLSPADLADLRARCLRAAHDRWNWETESAKLVALYASLPAAPATAGMPAPPRPATD